jgi:hypothetical protein
MASYLPNQLFQVPLAELQPDPARPRKYMDPVALDEMTASVGPVGIIQPVVCRQDPVTGLVYVVAGERRCLKIVWEGQEKSLTIGGGMRDKATNTPATPLNDAHPGGYFYVQ